MNEKAHFLRVEWWKFIALNGLFYSCSAEATAKETLKNVMAEALSKAGSNHSAVKAVCLSLSGVNHPSDQQRILGWLRSLL